MFLITRITHLFWLEKIKNEGRGSFEADEANVKSNHYLPEDNVKKRMELSDSL